MTITNCPKCGSMNITTAGVCANCGWSQFAQVTTVSTRITGEIEIMLSGKALLDDYKRLLFENNSLTVRIAELETKIRHNALWQASEDAEERAHLEKLALNSIKRIAELKWFIGQLIEAGDAMSNAHSMWVAEEDKWDALVKDWKERER